MQENKVLNLLSKMHRNMNQWFNKIKKKLDLIERRVTSIESKLNSANEAFLADSIDTLDKLTVLEEKLNDIEKKIIIISNSDHSKK